MSQASAAVMQKKRGCFRFADTILLNGAKNPLITFPLFQPVTFSCQKCEQILTHISAGKSETGTKKPRR